MEQFLSDFTVLRTYARFIEEEGRRETWVEAVDRDLNWLFRDPNIPQKVKTKSREHILNKVVFPSMRGLWSSGPAADRQNAAMYNCSFLGIDSLESFGEALLILMSGTGVGFSVERKFVDLLPKVSFQSKKPAQNHIVGDSREGWQNALNTAITAWFNGRECNIDYSQLRKKGAPLRTMGGRSSGGAVLKELLNYAKAIITNAQGRNLTPLECHDIMCQLASAVIVGGTRRSALISLSDLFDEEIRNCKGFDHHPRRSGANNSAVYHSKPSMIDFLQEWSALVKSQKGERGIANLWAVKQNAPHRRKSKLIEGLNPCFRGDMKILTSEGYRELSTLADGSDVELINKNGDTSTGKVWSSGVKDTVRINFSGGSVPPIYCTPNHKFMLTNNRECEAVNLKGERIMPFIEIKDNFNKEDFLAGFIQGDGNTSRITQPDHRGMEVEFGEKDGDIAKMYGRPTGEWRSREVYNIAERYQLSPETLPTRCLPPRQFITPDFISGLFSANGCVIKKYRVALKSTCFQLVAQLKILLEEWFDIESYITTNKSTEVKFSNGTYTCRESYDINIGKYESILLFAKYISFGHQYKRDDLKDLILIKSPSVSSVKDVGKYEVYDFSEPTQNWGVIEGFIAHNCGEVALRNRGFCNLTSVVVRPDDDYESLRDKISSAAWLGTIQSTFTHFPNLRPEWKENAEEERLCGISLSGQQDNPSLLTPDILRLLKNHAVNVCRKASKILNINMPAAVTTTKPEGTCSLVAGSSAGCHPRWSEYYVKSVQIAVTDPLFHLMADQGAPYIIPQDNGQSTAIIGFPIKSPDGAITRHDMTAMDQLEHYLKLTDNYVEHNVSQTVYVAEDEWMKVGSWIYDHFDKCCGLSFFPKETGVANYDWLPFREIDKNEYDKLRSEFPDIDFTKLPDYERGQGDQTAGSKEYACAGGACEI